MLENINLQNDLKTMEYSDLEALSGEIRERILSVVSKNGGHLASNLGAVELTVALHRCFNLPDDKIVFDVGHQCYAHKLLTGRNDRFDSLRQKDGISGFVNRFESEYDALTAGHSGPSVSQGLGIAKANKLCGNDNYVVSVVGDGSFTNGMIYEALNNCDKKLKFIIVLNDNEMSISANVGNLSKHFAKVRTSRKYFRVKHKIKNGFEKIPFAGKGLISFFSSGKRFFKKIVLSGDGFFSALGIKYLGPVDGHDIRKLEDVLNEAKSFNECCIVLIKTKKGKGYENAEEKPENYHAVGTFDLDEGVVKNESSSFSDVFGRIIVEKAREDEKIVSLTAAMCEGTGLLEFSNEFPDRFFDVGIAEEHQFAFASGLSAGGMKPCCAVYSTFSQRVYDQLFHDFSVQKLPLVVALDRSGFVADDGITHQGLFDVSLFSSIPDVKIYSPETYDEMKVCFDKSFDESGVSIVRYPKGCQTDYDRSGFVSDEEGNTFVYGDTDADIVVVTYGRVTKEAFEAVNILRKHTRVMLVKLVKVYPFDAEAILNASVNARLVYVLEEGIKSGGIGEKISASLAGKFSGRVVVNAVDNECVSHAKVDELLECFGMTAKQIVMEIGNNIANMTGDEE